MQLQPIVYVTDMERAISWYSNLLDSEPTVASDFWTSFSVGGGSLALHYTDENLAAGSVELSLVTEALETVMARVETVDGITEQPFGRSIVVVDPEGTKIQVNEHSEQ